jgi:hypothetical protein
MTLNHWWTTLVVLLLACVTRTAWAQDKAPCPCKTPEPACCADRGTCAADKSPCCDKSDKQGNFTFAFEIKLGDKVPCCDKGDKQADTTAACCDKCCAGCKSCSACSKEAQTTKAKTKKASRTVATPTIVVVPMPAMMPYPPSCPEPMGPFGFGGCPYGEPPPPPVEMAYGPPQRMVILHGQPQPTPVDMAYGYTPPPPPLPAPTPVAPVPAIPAMPVVERIAVEQVKTVAPQFVFRAVSEDGQGRLQIHSGDLCATCENLAIKANGGESFLVCVDGKQVHLKGHSFKASADSITRVGQEDRFILEGHVSLKSDRDGQHADVSAQRVFVNLAEGSFEIKPAAKPAVAAPPVIPASAPFNFSMGFFH